MSVSSLTAGIAEPRCVGKRMSCLFDVSPQREELHLGKGGAQVCLE